MASSLHLQNLSLGYQGVAVVEGIELHLAEGEIGGFLGASGCGKSTLLRAIAGFEPVMDGRIIKGTEVLSSDKKHVAPERRRIAMMFQDFALFPHLDVAQNVAFGIGHLKSTDRNIKVNELLALVGLSGYQRRSIDQLSGGQQQRVALARALAVEPDILLLDEPFSSLDTELRESLALELRDIIKARGISALVVTHDQLEAFAMCDKVAVIQQGKLLQWDSPYALYHEPNSLAVASFIGRSVMLEGVVKEPGKIATSIGIFATNDSRWQLQGVPVKVLVRPDDIEHIDASPYRAKVLDKVFKGPYILYSLALSEHEQAYCYVPSHHNHAIGEEIGIMLDIQHLVCFPA